jgi:hypothetical protein
MTAFLDAALAYAAAHLPVFPLVPGDKVPAIKRGFYAATTNPETIRRYWRIPDRNIGIRTGIGFWVLDVDPPDGEENIRRLEAEHGRLPPTRTVITPRGGRHLWFKCIGPVPSSVGRIADCVDARADRAYVVGVPSITTDGSYSWLGDPKAPLAIAPDWLIELATRKKPAISERAVAAITKTRFENGGGAYGRAALERECAELAATPAGRRNHRLNYTAFRLFQLVAGGELDDRGIEDRLIEACQRNGLIAKDGLRSVEKTIASGRAAGLQFPRSRKGAT